MGGRLGAVPGRSPAPRALSSRPLRRLAALVATAALSACWSGDAGEDEAIPSPPPTRPTTTTTAPPDYSGVALGPPVAGRTTTTTVVVGPGQATLGGTALGPDGPVTSATVRIERVMGSASASVDVAAQADGTWTLPAVLGGRYRLRAWRAPDLAMVEPVLVFLGATETLSVELKLERFAGPVPAAAVIPDPPVVEQPALLEVFVTDRSVDAEGVVHAVPVPGLRIELRSAGNWVARTPNPTVTDATGRARWEVVCRLPGPQPLAVVVPGAEPFPLTFGPCAEPAPAPPQEAGQPGPAARPPPPATTARPTTTTRPPATTATTRPRSSP